MATTWKTVRVFISSTFRDMHAERDHLVKVVFPALRERLEKHRVHLIDIDLRWGVTREQAENDQVLDLCLQQIDECRPFFIGILGQRYGWVPTRYPADAVKKFGWIQQHTGKSVTELEVIHGVLQNPQMRGRAFFYFRDPVAIQPVPEAIRRAVYAETYSGQIEKLEDLKNKIRHSGYPVMDNYPARWDPEAYDRPSRSHGRLVVLEAFGERVRDQLWQAIQEEYKLPEQPPVETTADPLAEELDYHERFMESRLRVYVGRQQINDDLFAFADGSDQFPCLVTGESGSGKSSALARFVADYSTKHQQEIKDGTILVVPHFIGASPRSTNLRYVLRRFCQVFKARFGFTEDVPEEVAKLSVTFREFVGKVPADTQVLLVIDALNQLDEAEHAQDLYWLSAELPPQVKVIVSCITDSGKTEPVLEAFRWRKHCPVQLAALSDAEQREIIRRVPSLSAKTLDDDQVHLLLSNPATANPLFLLVALEELRGYAPYERLNERIAAFPREGDTVTAIFTQVVERLAEEFNPKLVETVLSLLASARRGLSERELQELVAGLDGADDLFPVLRQLRPYLLSRTGLIGFYHNNLLKAVCNYYLDSDEKQMASHIRLAYYFRSIVYADGPLSRWRTDRPRGLSELPYHLARGRKWGELETTFTDLRFLEAKTLSELGEELLDELNQARPHCSRSLESYQTLIAEHAWTLFRLPLTLYSLAWMRRLAGESELRDFFRRHPQRLLGLLVHAEDTQQKSAFQRFLKHGEAVWAVRVHPKDGRVFSAGDDKTVRSWDLSNRQQIDEWKNHQEIISSLAVSRCGQWLASADMKGNLVIRNLGTGSIHLNKGSGGGVWCVAIDADANVVATGGFWGFCNVLDLNTGEILSHGRTPWPPAGVTGVGFINNGEVVVTASRDGRLRIWFWRYFKGECLISGSLTKLRPITSLCIHRSEGIAYCATEGSQIVAIRLEAELMAGGIPLKAKATRSGWIVKSAGQIIYYRQFAEEVLRTGTGEGRDNCMALSNSGGLLAVGKSTGEVIVFETPGLHEIERHRPGDSPVRDVCFANDEASCLAATDDASVYLCGREPNHHGPTTSIDGSRLSEQASLELHWEGRDRFLGTLRMLRSAKCVLRARDGCTGLADVHYFRENRGSMMTLQVHGTPAAISPCGNFALFWDHGPIVLDLRSGSIVLENRSLENRFLRKGDCLITAKGRHLIIANGSPRWDNRGFAHCIDTSRNTRDTALFGDPGKWTTAIACSLSPTFVAIGGAGGEVRVYDLEEDVFLLHDDPQAITRHCFAAGIAVLWISRDSRNVAVGLESGEVYFGPTSNLQLSVRLPIRHSAISHIVPIENEQLLLVVGRLGDTSIWNLVDLKCVCHLQLPEKINWIWPFADRHPIVRSSSGTTGYVLLDQFSKFSKGTQFTTET